MEYKVLNHIHWGTLDLEEDQIIVVTEVNKVSSLVFLKHYPEKSQLVHPKAIQTMVELNNLVKY